MRQLTLDIGAPAACGFGNFRVGPNRAAVEHLLAMLDEKAGAMVPVPTYLWGDAGAGKSHLLESVRAALGQRGRRCGWLDPETHGFAEFDEDWHALLVDDAERLDPAQQQIAFNWFVNAQTHRRWVLAAGALPPADLPLREDVRTRLGWGLVFELQPLGDDERRAVLLAHARERGLPLGDDVVEFMLRRFSRNLAHLIGLLDALDRFSLSTQRAITVPLLKTMLEASRR